jgi:hypothetical protein
MVKGTSSDLRTRVAMGVREYGIQNVLFRNAIAKRLGVNVTDMECLRLLFSKKLATPTELATHTGLSSGATTAMLDRLEVAGMIERQPNPEDRRGTLVSFRQPRPEVVGPWFISSRRAQDKLIGSFSNEELVVIADFFEKSVQMWEEERQKLLGN